MYKATLLDPNTLNKVYVSIHSRIIFQILPKVPRNVLSAKHCITNSYIPLEKQYLA